MYLQIPYSVARQIANHAQDKAPNEVCGLLVGIDRLVHHIIEVENIADTPQTNYLMNPTQQLQALKQIDEDNFEWIGVYHSHPSSPAIPSQTDIEDANNPDLIHIIVSLEGSQPHLKAWQINSHSSVTPIELIFDTQQPSQHEPLSNLQKLVIICSGIISVILLLAISFTLLPPAPQITPIP